jgi:hypothetical protein
MRNKWVAALGAGARALVLAASTFDSAEARRSGGFGGRSFAVRSFSAGPRFVARPSFVRVAPWRHRHVRRAFDGVPLVYGAYAYTAQALGAQPSVGAGSQAAAAFIREGGRSPDRLLAPL